MKLYRTVMAALALGTLVSGTGLAAKKPPAVTEEERQLDLMDQVNAQLVASGAGYRVAMAEVLTTDSDQGITVYARNLGNKQLTAHFVPGDSRNFRWSGTGPDITYTHDGTDNAYAPTSLSQATVEAAFDRAMTTWENVVCSVIPIAETTNSGGDLGVVEFIVSGGASGSGSVEADITFGGIGQVDGIQGASVLATTYTFVWVDDDSGLPTDIDGNGKTDVAFREIYFKGGWNWNINASIDVESVALHEAGHGLSQAHFGTIISTDSNGKFHFSPRAVMNAAYSGIQQAIEKSDNAGHCSIWGQWPNN